jgi:hypothetical protein
MVSDQILDRKKEQWEPGKQQLAEGIEQMRISLVNSAGL